MPAFFKFLAIIVAVGSSLTLTDAVPRAQDWTSLLDNFSGVDIQARHLTNGERLARGLPPNKPRFRRAGELRARTSPTPPPASVSVTSSSAAPQPTPTTLVGHISVVNSDGDAAGWISTSTGEGYGLYGITTTIEDALSVSVSFIAGTPADIITLNGDSDYHYLGAFPGPANTVPTGSIQAGTLNYAIILASDSTPLNSPAQPVPNGYTRKTSVQVDIESAIWLVDPVTHELTVQWTNVDGTSVQPTLFQDIEDDGFAFSADLDALLAIYGGGQLPPVSLFIV